MLDHQRLTDLFSEVAALPPGRRDIFLDSACVGEPELHRELLDLLRHEEPASAAFDIAEERIAQPPPEHGTIGPYELLELVGEGGMAVVYKAHQHKPVRRIVAVKLIKLGMDTRQFVARFDAERQALAMMDHPHVARVYDAGSTNTGRPYFVMEYVPGQRILEWCDARRLTVRERLKLFIPICEAVEHAHRKGIIHRDLKNSNILVTDVDGRALPKVIDFGVAKAVSERLTDGTMFTERGQIIGTPEYMSPEQAEHGALDVDTRADVYSLGVLLYQLLAGVKPVPPELLRDGGYEQIQRIIRDTVPVRPSTRLAALAAADATEIAEARRTPLPTLIRTLRSELEWIPLKAMRKDREQRYRSAAELADDIHNYLDKRPLIAGPESGWYRARKFLRRHKSGVAALAAMTLLLLVGIVTTTWQAVRASRERDNAKATLAFLTDDVLAGATPEKIPDAKVRDQIVKAMITPAAERVTESFKDRPLIEASVRDAIQGVLREIGRSDLALPHAEAALSIRRRLLGEDHADTVESLNNYGRVLRALGRFSDAEPVYRRALEWRQRNLGTDHADTLSSMNNYAGILERLERITEAEPLFKQALERRRRVLGEDHLSTIMSLNNYAHVLHQMGRFADAEPLAREVLERRRRLQGEEHPLTLLALNNYADELDSLGRSNEAEPLFKQALEGYRKVLGVDHPSTMMALSNYAWVLRTQNRNAEAEPLFKQVLEQHRRVLGEEHPDTIRAMTHYANALELVNRSAEAEPLARHALELNRRVLGQDHRNTLLSENGYAIVLASLGRDSEAGAMFKDLYERCRRVLGDAHAETIAAAGSYAKSLLLTGQAADGEALARRALTLATASPSLGGKHPRTRTAADVHAQCLDAVGRHDEAVAVRREYELPAPTTRASTQPATRRD